VIKHKNVLKPETIFAGKGFFFRLRVEVLWCPGVKKPNGQINGKLIGQKRKKERKSIGHCIFRLVVLFCFALLCQNEQR